MTYAFTDITSNKKFNYKIEPLIIFFIKSLYFK